MYSVCILQSDEIPTNIISVAIRNWRDWDDVTWHAELGKLVLERLPLLRLKAIRRITFIVFKGVGGGGRVAGQGWESGSVGGGRAGGGSGWCGSEVVVTVDSVYTRVGYGRVRVGMRCGNEAGYR